MAKELTIEQVQRRARARKAAKAAGKDWKNLSKDERRAFLLQTRKALNPVRQRAREAAEAKGKNWRQLSLEERQTYVKNARRGLRADD